MKIRSIVLLLLISMFGMVSCKVSLSKNLVPGTSLPIGVSLDIHDARCLDIIHKQLPTILNNLEIPFEHLDYPDSVFSIGPIIEESLIADYSKVKQQYVLFVRCYGDLTTSISGDVALDGLNAGGEWVGISDHETIKLYGMRLLGLLNL